MKHLIAKEHHRHLKKRAIIELFGLVILCVISINERSLITDSLRSIGSADKAGIILLVSCYWALLPLTAISYRMLSGKKIAITTTALAQLAAAGPGRIIPGGLGHLSFAAVHLSHEGITIKKAVVVSIANNLIGLAANILIIIAALINTPRAWHTVADNVSAVSLLLFSIGLLAVVVLLMWLSHARSTRRTIRSVNTEWMRLTTHLLKNPLRIVSLLFIAIIITLGHIVMLQLAGEAVTVSITFTDAILALSVGVLLGGAIPTPGGIGAVEAGTSTSLILLGYTPEQALSSALLFRAVSYWMPLLPGALSYVYLRRRSLL